MSSSTDKKSMKNTPEEPPKEQVNSSAAKEKQTDDNKVPSDTNGIMKENAYRYFRDNQPLLMFPTTLKRLIFLLLHDIFCIIIICNMNLLLYENINNNI
ncbi:hypothetical protein CBL_00063 [Carabus blaptoides fortunei]